MTSCIMVLAAIVCTSTTPRPSPQEAIAILQASHSPLDLTSIVYGDGPISASTTWIPDAPMSEPAPLFRNDPGYTVYAPGRRYGYRSTEPRSGARVGSRRPVAPLQRAPIAAGGKRRGQ
jgi:hypothetical protein